jgi:hypothetical protein
MPGRKSEPEGYVATETLHIYNPESGAMPAAAFHAGDKVPPEMVGPNGWADKVKPLDAFTAAPGKPAGHPAETE